ncbi:MAG TPA: IS200/IS605 family transposase [Pyrinomonadaceae bacterium]|nr:IS200/IS605 family transposase [Pyrinomonadaceae bacterium]
MFLRPYSPHELKFAYCYRVYVRFRTYKCRPYRELALLQRATLDSLLKPYGLRVLKLATDSTDVLSILSLQPTETVSSAADKLKGRVSKWLREQLGLSQPENLVSKGYFAITIGKSRSEAVEKYLSSQSEHHGYDKRPLPPVFLQSYDLTTVGLSRLTPAHAVVVAQFHCVLATAKRRGVLGSAEGKKVATEWKRVEVAARFAIVKVSFVPDHVHLALRAHPAVSPAAIVVGLMNSAQEVLSNELTGAGLERLWQTTVYVGSFGSLASAQVRKYIENWEKEE